MSGERMAAPARLPLRCATSTDAVTHLVVASPALPWSEPDRLPMTVLCGLPAVAESSDNPGAVGCDRCLSRAWLFMALPSFEVATA